MGNFRIPIIKAELTGDDFEIIYGHIDGLTETISSLQKECDKQAKFIKKIFEMCNTTEQDVKVLLGDSDYNINIGFDHVDQKINIRLREI